MEEEEEEVFMLSFVNPSHTITYCRYFNCGGSGFFAVDFFGLALYLVCASVSSVELLSSILFFFSKSTLRSSLEDG